MNHKKLLSLVMCLCLMAAALSAVAYAAPTDGLCPHHTAHDANCGYVEYKAEVPCTHTVHDSACGYAAPVAKFCAHTSHDSACGYAAAVAASCAHTSHDTVCGYAAPVAKFCAHTAHDGTCGYSAAVAESCDHLCSAEQACIDAGTCVHVHDATSCVNYVSPKAEIACGHVCAAELGCVAAKDEVPCGHVCAAELGCVAAKDEVPCGHVCSADQGCVAAKDEVPCKHLQDTHDDTCGYSAEVPENTCTFAQGCSDCNPFLKAFVTVASAGSYSGLPKTPEVTVVIDDVTLVLGIDYSIEYTNNVNAGTETATVTVTGMGSYAGHTASRKFSIAPAELNITADNVSKTYGEADPAFTYTVSGLMQNESPDAVLGGTLVRSPGEDAKDYEIFGGSLAIKEGVTNYRIRTFTRGKLTIEKKALTVTAADQAIVYGTALDETKVAADALVSGDTLASATLTPSTTDVVADGTITPKDAVIKNASGTNVAGNYNITYVPGKLSITAKEVTPTIELSPNRFAYTGQALKPTVKVMDGTTVIPASEYTLSYANNVNVGTASVSVADVDGGNYIIKAASAPFSIIQKQAYTIIAGNGQSYVSTNYYGISFTTNGPAANLTSIYIDNQPVSNAYYTVAPYTAMPGVNGSIVTLNTNLMNLLSNGTHSIVFNYSDGAVTGTFIKGAAAINGVRTGDDSAPGMMAIFMCLGLVGAAAILPALRKQRG